MPVTQVIYVVLLTLNIVNICQEDQRPSGAGLLNGAEAPIANPGSGDNNEMQSGNKFTF